MTIGRRWVVAASAILALQNTNDSFNKNYVNAFSSPMISRRNPATSISFYPSKLYSSAATTADETYETKSPENTNSGKTVDDNSNSSSSKQIIPGEVLYQSHQVAAIKLHLNNDVNISQPTIKEEKKEEQSPATAVFSKENMSKKKTNNAQSR